MSNIPSASFDTSRFKFIHEHQTAWNIIGEKNTPRKKTLGAYYHKRVQNIYQQLIPKGQRVLELGCGQGDLLAALSPIHAVGIDLSSARIEQAKNTYPELTWILGDEKTLKNINGPFDYIILSDFLQDSWDIQEVYSALQSLAHAGTRLIANYYSQLWEYPLRLGQVIHRTRPTLPQNWITVNDNKNLFALANWQTIRTWDEVLMPFSIPLLSAFCNCFLVKVWPFHHLALSHFVVAKSLRLSNMHPTASVTVVVPARNEAGNISAILQRMPNFGKDLEVIFVEGHSQDNTWQTILDEIKKYPAFHCRALQQTGKGKGDAVRLGFGEASGDILMILDADLTVAPELLPHFYQTLVDGHAEFVNGVRLVYPMEKKAMRFANFLGNKFFSLAFSALMSQPIKDTLCGTKVLWKKDYLRIAEGRKYFGNFDPFGDFDLLFGAAHLHLKIADMPVRYGERTYGSTNIQRWRHGILLLRMVFIAAKRLKFV